MSVSFTVYRGSASGKIVKDTTHKELRPDDVVLKITHSGLCYTDVHYRKSGICLGHEGVGIVEKVGPAVTHFKVGDHAGWGYVRNTCGSCEACSHRDDMYCKQGDFYGFTSTDQGAFASHTVVREAFLIPIPDGIDLKYAGPLMCGGATVFDALYRHGLKPTDRVGVIGIGGLGHLAIQFAAKMGCQVIVFSSTDKKREEAKAFGATEFYATKGVDNLALEKPIDVLIATASAQPDWKLYLPILNYRATIFPMTVDSEQFSIPIFALNTTPLTVQGSVVAPRWVFRKMLDFVAQHGIKPMIQEFPMTEAGIEQAFAALEAGTLRYRAVLVGQ
ncbi:GroES-like protein [Fistulina hepatica ATCC 64428]|uniref:GroES-like protein n=1 Tax=Fistulina hepatica ATCC 64428 TaxID=1128425 RepID=A0A0D7AK97_9AGAR|nr:GroES-like protein [Fistulina hepatica ATCC 64428]